jgi:transposase InsO family protein
VPEAKVLTDAWRRHYNHRRPHSALELPHFRGRLWALVHKPWLM